jgi:peptidyl-prolyl cis-trans isomerase A (cyclophilin A)
METLAAGFEKTESGLRYQFIQRGDGKQAEAGNSICALRRFTRNGKSV